MEHDHSDHGGDHHDRGLQFDLATIAAGRASAPSDPAPGLDDLARRRIGRRRALTLLGAGAGAAVLAACGASASDAGSTASTTSSGGTSSGGTSSGSTSSSGSAEAEVPEETAGPYPGDGSNGPDVLATSGVVRSDIRSSFGSMSGTAEGVPLTIRMRVTDLSEGGSALAGAAIYLWHCDREGRYSLYGDGVTDQNYLRGVQAADADGWLTFQSIYPAAYSGRWPHIHFEVYPSLADATNVANQIRTSQMALPEAPSRLVYATTGYDQSTANLDRTTLASDMVFSDGVDLQMADVTGDVSSGFTATLAIAVA